MSKNTDLNNARVGRNDEFYTQIPMIEAELPYYREHFAGKVVLCNCDDPKQSNFWVYFHTHFAELQLKQLIAVYYSVTETARVTTYAGGNDEDIAVGVSKPLEGTGDFRSNECIEILKQADIVVSNPPFSLAIPYLLQLIEYNKQFLIVGNINLVTCKDVIALLQDNKVWLGASIHSGDRPFYVPDNYPLAAKGCGVDDRGRKWIKVKGVRWYTNLDYSGRCVQFPTNALYRDKPAYYPFFDNTEIISVSKTKDIPMDYTGVMAVPCTFIDKYNPAQFEILGLERYVVPKEALKEGRLMLQGKKLYARIIIKVRGKEGAESG